MSSSAKVAIRASFSELDVVLVATEVVEAREPLPPREVARAIGYPISSEARSEA